MKMFKKAPLPFQGQKKNMISFYIDVIKKLEGESIIVDLFGGSGLLSHVAKRINPNLRVIYNDFDYYIKRIENVDITNEILLEIRNIVKSVKFRTKIPLDLKNKIILFLKELEEEGVYIDFPTISASITFSGKWINNLESLSKNSMYNCVVKNAYMVDEYLTGLEVFHEDYLDLLERFRGSAVFIVDPPYLNLFNSIRKNKMYKNDFQEKDHLELIQKLEGEKFLYFSNFNTPSDNSIPRELLQFILRQKEVFKRNNSVNKHHSFIDSLFVSNNLVMR